MFLFCLFILINSVTDIVFKGKKVVEEHWEEHSPVKSYEKVLPQLIPDNIFI